jgi:hypothetical protein
MRTRLEKIAVWLTFIIIFGCTIQFVVQCNAPTPESYRQQVEDQLREENRGRPSGPPQTDGLEWLFGERDRP